MGKIFGLMKVFGVACEVMKVFCIVYGDEKAFCLVCMMIRNPFKVLIILMYKFFI